jgi:hypothetical protein
MRRWLWGALGVAVGATSWATGIAFSRQWQPRLPWSGAVVPVGLATAAAVLVLVHWRRKNRPGHPLIFAFTFLGLGSCAAALGGLLMPPAAEPPHPQPVRVAVVVEATPVVLFDDAAVAPAGPLHERNALVAAARTVCARVEQMGGRKAYQQRPPFLDWLVANAALLVNWQAPPPPVAVRTQPVSAELYRIDGDGCRRVDRPREALTDAFDRALAAAAIDPGPPGLSPEVRRLLGPADGRLVILVATGDFEDPADVPPWRAALEEAPGPMISVLLPSVPRAGYAPLRSRRFKGDAVKRRDRTLVWLAPPPAADPGVPGAEEVAVLFGALDGLDNLGAWDEPRDLDRQRHRYFGPTQARRVNAAAGAGALDRLDALVFDRGTVIEAPGTTAWSWRPFAAAGLLWAVLAVGVGVIPERSIALGAEKKPGWAACGFALLTGVIGLCCALGAVFVLWPGEVWQQNGRPALAVWAFTAAFTVLLLWPLVYRLVSPSPRWGAALALALAAHPLAGALVPALPAWGFALSLLAPVAMVGVCWLYDRIRRREEAPAPENQGQATFWSRPWYWGPASALAAFGLAVLLVGASRAEGGTAPFQAGLGLLWLAVSSGAAAGFCLAHCFP